MMLIILFLHVYLQPEKSKDLVAQLAEHLPFKERVLGSSPSQVTFFNDLIAQLVEHLPFKERVLGSSPSQVTSILKRTWRNW